MKNTIKIGTKITVVILAFLIVALSVLAIYQYKNEQQKITEMEKLLSDMSATVEELDSETKAYKDYKATAQVKAAHYDQISDFLLRKENAADRLHYITFKNFDWDFVILDRCENDTGEFTVLPGYHGPVLSDPSIVSLKREIKNWYGSERFLVTAQDAGSTVITFKTDAGALYEVLVIVL